MFEIDESGGKTQAGGAAVLPVKRSEIAGDAILVHFKVATPNKLVVLGVAQAVAERMTELRVSGHKIDFIVTQESVEMTIADQQKIAQFVVPYVLKALGLKGG